jgi:hypothetical protein
MMYNNAQLDRVTGWGEYRVTNCFNNFVEGRYRTFDVNPAYSDWAGLGRTGQDWASLGFPRDVRGANCRSMPLNDASQVMPTGSRTAIYLQPAEWPIPT